MKHDTCSGTVNDGVTVATGGTEQMSVTVQEEAEAAGQVGGQGGWEVEVSKRGEGEKWERRVDGESEW